MYFDGLLSIKCSKHIKAVFFSDNAPQYRRYHNHLQRLKFVYWLDQTQKKYCPLLDTLKWIQAHHNLFLVAISTQSPHFGDAKYTNIANNHYI